MATKFSTADPLTDAFVHLIPVLGDVKNKFDEMFASAQTWVQQLSPSTILVLDQQFRNLQATLGEAFVPAFQLVADGFHRMGAVILPLMEQLRPIFTDLAQAMEDFQVSATAVITSIVQTALPVLKVAFDFVSEALKIFARAMIITAANILQWFPGGTANLEKALENAISGQGRIAAPQEGTISTAAQIANQISAAAFAAQGKTEQEKTNDFLQDILATIRGYRSDTGRTSSNSSIPQMQALNGVPQSNVSWSQK